MNWYFRVVRMDRRDAICQDVNFLGPLRNVVEQRVSRLRVETVTALRLQILARLLFLGC